jgi:hypothetical protein
MLAFSTPSSRGDFARRLSVLDKVRAYAASISAKLRNWGPYAVMGLLPGGSVIVLLFWIYRRRQEIGAIVTRGGLF